MTNEELNEAIVTLRNARRVVAELAPIVRAALREAKTQAKAAEHNARQRLRALGTVSGTRARDGVE